jgi:hypothetical protein
MSGYDFLVRRNALAQCETRALQAAPLAGGQVRLRIDSFALTANNITYAAFGDTMNYWGFYPAEDGWGRIPVWGFASVEQSLHPGVAVGERLYGYFPMASSVVLTPQRLTPGSFMEGAAHRVSLHAVYNQYLRCSADPVYQPGTEDLQALLRPLFTTSWLIDDFLHDNDFFGATVMLLSSASSKTAYGTAFQLIQRPGIEVVGLTSAANRAFCESLGCYSRVISYEELDQVAADAAGVYVDFAGNAGLREAIHTRFTNLKYSCSIGGTHVEQLSGSGKRLPGPRATLFFAPAQIQKRRTDWGAEQLGKNLLKGWQAFLGKVSTAASPWIEVRHHDGVPAVQATYLDVLGGRGNPRVGHILSLSR